MENQSQVNPTPVAQLLLSLGFAADEARQERSLIQSENTATRAVRENSHSRRLRNLDREIDYLETRIAEIRSRAYHA